MKKPICLLFIILSVITSQGYSQAIKIREPVRFLALGDSYTVGQGVATNERWPEQFVSRLSMLGYDVDELKIIAQTGWRTDNLQNAINLQMPLDGYNLVALLIGVNNQFQGGSVEIYSQQFQELLQQAVSLAGNEPQRVFVLSIPDYAYTAYGNGNPTISAAIDNFNLANRTITGSYGIRYVDITPISRNGLEQPELISGDGLHPSGLQYSLWVNEIVKYVEKEVGLAEKPGFNRQDILEFSGNRLWISSEIENGVFIVYDASGKIVLTGAAQAVRGSGINLESIPAGIYFVKLILENKQIFSQKFFNF